MSVKRTDSAMKVKRAAGCANFTRIIPVEGIIRIARRSGNEDDLVGLDIAQTKVAESGPLSDLSWISCSC